MFFTIFWKQSFYSAIDQRDARRRDLIPCKPAPAQAGATASRGGTAAMPPTLKAQLEADIIKGEAEEAAKPGLHHGTDWWQLSDAEEEVFAIDRERFIRMVMTWHCYEGFKLISHSPVWDEALIEQARQQHPEWCAGGVDEKEFFRFAKEFGGLTFRA
jgi:hypothetical protein